MRLAFPPGEITALGLRLAYPSADTFIVAVR